MNFKLDLSGITTAGAPTMPVSSYLSSSARTLREACHETGRDAAGRNCIDCPLAKLCEKEAQAGFVRDYNHRCLAMPVSSYLSSPARTLREACHETGRDAGGRNCIDCPVADLCEKEARRMAERG